MNMLARVWLYRHVRGIGDNVAFTFVGQTGRGDLHLAAQHREK